jgi:hypothetical protein
MVLVHDHRAGQEASLDPCESAQEPLRAPINDGLAPFLGLVFGLSIELGVAVLAYIAYWIWIHRP